MKLILLTKYYPYGSGEAFIENEIKILSGRFQSVVIIACEVDESMEKYARSLPQNILVCKVKSKKGILQKILDFLNIFRLDLDNDTKQELKSCRGIFQKLFCLYFESKCSRIYRIIQNSYKSKVFSDEECILYSYWLFVTARVAIKMANMLKNCELIVSRAHGYDLYEEINFLKYLPYRKLLLEKLDLIFPCSSYGAKYLINKYPIIRDKIKLGILGTCYYGKNPDNYNNKFTVVSCSRVVPVKRIEFMIYVMSVLEKNGYFIRWTHIGDGAVLNKMKKLSNIKLKKIEVEFIGAKKNKEILQYYSENHVDIFMNMSSSEGLPVSIMEAMSFGIPAIATDVGGSSEIVINDYNGILVNKNISYKKVAQLIINFIQAKELNKILYSNMRDNAYKVWEQRFQAEDNYEKMINEVLYAKTDSNGKKMV